MKKELEAQISKEYAEVHSQQLLRTVLSWWERIDQLNGDLILLK